jgi:2-dehydropantoate 2-reductase
MHSPGMRYVIYGAGAIGGAIGATLHDAGREVVLIARGDHLAALRQVGLTVQMPDRDLHARIAAVASPNEIGIEARDVVLLATKSQDTFAALEALVKAADANVAIVCAQNGVGNEPAALRNFARVYGMFVYVAAQHLEPGSVQLFSSPSRGVLDLGRAPHGSDECAEAIAQDLQAAGFASRVDSRIMRWKYAKLLSNLANAVEALIGADAPGGEFVHAARAEALACFAVAGIDYAASAEVEARTAPNEQPKQVKGRSRTGGSSWQSLVRDSGAIETDYLNGEIVRLGRVHGVATPVNAALCRLASRMVLEHLPPGSLGPLDIEREIELGR